MKMNEWVSAKEGLTLLTNKSFHGKGFSRVCIKVGLRGCPHITSAAGRGGGGKPNADDC